MYVTTNRTVILLIALSCAGLGAGAAGSAADAELVKGQHAGIGVSEERVSERSRHPDTRWFPDAGLGLFLHWGISSVRGMNISWPMIPGRPLRYVHVTDPEDREQIIRDQNFNLDGWGPEITPLEYWSMAEGFNPDNYHPEVWLKRAKEAGFTYAILTAKHHEGFALWPSAYGDFNTRRFADGKDLIKTYVEACRKVGLKVGIYYSGPDWYFDQDHMNFLYYRAARKNPEIPPLGPDLRPRTGTFSEAEIEKHQQAYAELVRGQVEELLTHYGKIDMIWFDGKPPIPGGDNVISQERIRELQPGILINPRMHGEGDFKTYERHLPETRPESVEWAEFCNPWNGNWPYVDQPYRCLGFVLKDLVTSRAWGINYLLGIGPMANGDLAPAAYKNMDKLKAWIDRNKEAVYEVRPLPFGEEASVLASAGNRHRYLYLVREFRMRGTRSGTSEEDMLPVQDETVTFQGGGAVVDSVVYMPTGESLPYSIDQNGRLSIPVPAEKRSKLVDVIRITFAE